MSIRGLSLVPAAEFADYATDLFEADESNRYAGHKALAVLEPGTIVTLVVPHEARERVGLLYDTDITGVNGRYEMEDSGRAVTMIACLDRRTQVPGGFVLRMRNVSSGSCISAMSSSRDH